ncbi:MAG: hypothetical protein Tsb008_09920 [Rhodothalassiaceae bacterium]
MTSENTTFLARLKDGLKRTSARLSGGIADIFTKRRLDQDALDALEELLIGADIGVEVSARLVAELSRSRFGKDVSPDEVREALAAGIESILAPVARPLALSGDHKPHVILMVGVNGAGKTTTIGKLAQQFRDQGKKVMLAAGDTFRAAAVEQLMIWGRRTGAETVTARPGADPAGLAYEAMDKACAAGADVLLIDTAGRLQNREELMAELAKIVRVIGKKDETAPHDTILVLDASTGQNALRQAEIFGEMAKVSGLVMTKLDGSAKGGVLVAVADRFHLPIHAIGVGEDVSDLRPFDPGAFARTLVGLPPKEGR